MAASSSEVVVENILSNFTTYIKKPEKFLSNQKQLGINFRCLTKKLYDLTKTVERPTDSSSEKNDTLPELIIDDFDDEQIWQEIEMQNTFCIARLTQSLARVLLQKNQLSLTTDPQYGAENEREDKGGGFDEEEETISSEEEEDIPELPPNKAPLKKTTKPKRTSVVDDKFFKLSDMEEFLKIEDRREMKLASKKKDDDDESSEEEEEEEIDFFQDIPSDDDEAEDGDSADHEKKDYHYEEFFDSPDAETQTVQTDQESGIDDMEDVDDEMLYKLKMKQEMKARKNEEVGDDESDEEGEDLEDIMGGKNEPKSTFEIRQEKLKRKIAELEESNLAEKPWQLLGEADATCRPENSLLQENLQFDHMQRQAPVITEETTLKLEDIIKQRIKDIAWDDVERKIKPVEQPFEYKRRIILDQEKSKQSLAEIYEKEYLKQQQEEKQEEEPKEHTQIKKMMESLFIKLDALSNFHFTPKPKAPEIKVINNLPTITVEEVAPVTASSASLLAPGEIMEKPHREVKGTTEKDTTDRKRERRLKKLKQKEKFKNRVKKDSMIRKLGPELGRKYSKEAALKILEKGNVEINVEKDSSFKYSKTGLKSSKNFFAKLQDEVTNQIHTKKVLEKKKKKNANMSGVKLKL